MSAFRKLAAIALLSTVLWECSPRHLTDQGGVSRKEQMAQLQQMVGQTVTLTGRALDAHSGAVLLLSDDTPIYIPVLEYWPAAFASQKVEVRGVLRRRKLIPEPDRDPVSHGAEGEDFLLENASWRRR